EELPYSVAVEIDEFREAQEPVYIRAVIYVERASQKGIVIGGGAGPSARSAKRHAPRSRPSSAAKCSWISTSRSCPSGGAALRPSSVWATPSESRARAAGDFGLPQVQGPARASHGADRGPGMSGLSADLRGGRRHSHHADRRGAALLTA